MKRMIPWSAAVLACGLVLTGGLRAGAQDTGQTPAQGAQTPQHEGRRHHAGQRAAKLAQKLGLSESQKTQIKSILAKAKDQRKSIQTSQLSQADKQAKLKELRKNTHSQIAGVLTAEQKAKLKEMRQEHHKGKGA